MEPNKPFSTLQLYPVYQPIVDRQLSIVGYESFIRGTDANRVLADFLSPSLQRLDRIVAMDTLCKQLALEKYTGAAPLFLNSHPYSSNPFLQPLSLPKRHGLVIELNEHALVNEEQLLLKNVEWLSASGVSFAIDDFGCGFLSFPFIMRLNPGFIKLAKEVIQSCSDMRSREVVKRIVQPFRDMGIQIIAEGIESEAQYESLQSVVDAFQGYWISKPKILLGA
ncbi:EAL domain-containing protein [Paenibacillus sp. GYB003]|uniref:EAL domain-containing protein n=1 Tax=Paenibacillus sp. GYB003 TaxID=2994392 RepID=UPI002F96C55B